MPGCATSKSTSAVVAELSAISRRVCDVSRGLVRLARREFYDFSSRLAVNFHVSFEEFGLIENADDLTK